jgi:hypothetical protein
MMRRYGDPPAVEGALAAEAAFALLAAGAERGQAHATRREPGNADRCGGSVTPF